MSNYRNLQSMKDKTCRYCKAKFTPKLKTAIVCGETCALGLIEKRQQRDNLKLVSQDRREIKTRLRALKTRSQWMKDVQVVFNNYIRLRDKALPCISCGRFHNGQYHAGHFRSVGSTPSLRFEISNVHKQCAPCNNHLSGNIVLYRIALIKKIGIKKVDWLEGSHDPKHYSIDDLIELKQFYKAKINEIIKTN